MNKGLICLFLNLLTPGSGTLVAGDTSKGFWQYGLWISGLVIFIFGVITSYFIIGLFILPFAVIPMGIAFVWALMDGLKYKDTLTGNLTEGNLAFIFNLFLPGIGTVIYGDKNNGLWQFLLYLYGGIIGGLGTPVGLIWAIIDGIRLNETLTEEIGVSTSTPEYTDTNIDMPEELTTVPSEPEAVPDEPEGIPEP